MLRQILENEIQLGVLENLHMVLRRRGIVGEDLGNILGGHAEILGNLVNAVFKIKRHTYFLLSALGVLTGRGLPPLAFILALGEKFGCFLPAGKLLGKRGGEPRGEGQIGEAEHAASALAQHGGKLRLRPGQRLQRCAVTVQKTRGAFLRVGGSVGGEHQKPPLSGGDRRAASFLADGEHPALPGETEILRCLIHRPPPVPP